MAEVAQVSAPDTGLDVGLGVPAAPVCPTRSPARSKAGRQEPLHPCCAWGPSVAAEQAQPTRRNRPWERVALSPPPPPPPRS